MYKEIEVCCFKTIRQHRCFKGLVRDAEHPAAIVTEKVNVMAAVSELFFGGKGITQLAPIQGNAVNHIQL